GSGARRATSASTGASSGSPRCDRTACWRPEYSTERGAAVGATRRSSSVSVSRTSRMSFRVARLVAVLSTLAGGGPARAQSDPPPVARELRAVWVATVDNMDWPSKAGLPASEQQSELIAILDRLVQLRMNAVVLQVRPAADALYRSDLEPWSEVLTGTMGRAPEPFYDPLAFAITEAHKRALELHAWINPYRARYSLTRPASSNHVSRTHPELMRRYGPYLWMDPGDARVRDLTTRVVLDIVRRYDI